jgi:uncharacterized membrane protein YidH (DUF202 family)
VSVQRLVGIVLLVIGGVLLVVGINASNSVTDQVTDAFTGRFTQSTMWYLIGGAVSALVGLLLVLFGVRGKLA